MGRFCLLLINEFKLFRTAIPIHLVAILQPTIMFVLMSAILVFPTFDMHVAQPLGDEETALVSAMTEVGSPIGLAYINPLPVPWDGGQIDRQVVLPFDTPRAHMVEPLLRVGAGEGAVLLHHRPSCRSSGPGQIALLAYDVAFDVKGRVKAQTP